MDNEEGVKKALEEPVTGRRSRERQRIRWRDKVKDDMEGRGLVEENFLIEIAGEGTSGNRPLR